jgi:hypothetical protein
LIVYNSRDAVETSTCAVGALRARDLMRRLEAGFAALGALLRELGPAAPPAVRKSVRAPARAAPAGIPRRR